MVGRRSLETSTGSYNFYRPFDPRCPDNKRDGECLETIDDGYLP
jgi:hypothetical protein